MGETGWLAGHRFRAKGNRQDFIEFQMISMDLDDLARGQQGVTLRISLDVKLRLKFNACWVLESWANGGACGYIGQAPPFAQDFRKWLSEACCSRVRMSTQVICYTGYLVTSHDILRISPC